MTLRDAQVRNASPHRHITHTDRHGSELDQSSYDAVDPIGWQSRHCGQIPCIDGLVDPREHEAFFRLERSRAHVERQRFQDDFRHGSRSKT